MINFFKETCWMTSGNKLTHTTMMIKHMSWTANKTIRIAMGLSSPMRSKSSWHTRSEIELTGHLPILGLIPIIFNKTLGSIKKTLIRLFKSNRICNRLTHMEGTLRNTKIQVNISKIKITVREKNNKMLIWNSNAYRKSIIIKINKLKIRT